MIPRTITNHRVPEIDAAAQVRIETLDPPGTFGANFGVNFDYRIDWLSHGASALYYMPHHGFSNVDLHFHGARFSPHPLGISDESLLAILIDRLVAMNAGPSGCLERASALYHCQIAIELLKAVTARKAEHGEVR